MIPAEAEIFALPDGLMVPPTHPGETIEAELAARGLTAHAAAPANHAESRRARGRYRQALISP
jgi:hypothetical protein